mmetsp:Transcript_69461/g.116658  ORF Transcript_69461/g.116658 Transcript_69461/m.116658 type:complete len:115 (+) Transcript_69461:3462-3806(+)
MLCMQNSHDNRFDSESGHSSQLTTTGTCIHKGWGLCQNTTPIPTTTHCSKIRNSVPMAVTVVCLPGSDAHNQRSKLDSFNFPPAFLKDSGCSLIGQRLSVAAHAEPLPTSSLSM